MPVKYVCKECGHTLYEFHYGRDSRGLSTPSEIIAMYNGKCPKCGRKLQKPDIKDIEIKIREETPVNLRGRKNG